MARRLAEREPATSARPTQPPDAPPARLSREGEYWTVSWAGRVGRLRDVKGLRYLAYLLAHPGREVHVLDLLALSEGLPDGDAVAHGRDGIDAFDGRARDAYRVRLADLRHAAADAEADGDVARASHLAAEIGRLEVALVAAYGVAPGSAPPRDPRSTGERARKSVANRLRAAVERLAAVDADLGRHLDIALRTGTLCVYRPEHDPRWTVEV